MSFTCVPVCVRVSVWKVVISSSALPYVKCLPSFQVIHCRNYTVATGWHVQLLQWMEMVWIYLFITWCLEADLIDQQKALRCKPSPILPCRWSQRRWGEKEAIQKVIIASIPPAKAMPLKGSIEWRYVYTVNWTLSEDSMLWIEHWSDISLQRRQTFQIYCSNFSTSCTYYCKTWGYQVHSWYRFLCLSVCLSVCLSLCLSVSLFISELCLGYLSALDTAF